MDILKNMVNDLAKETDTETQITALQEIGKVLLSTKILVGNITVEPLWVEAYYYNAGKNFLDQSVHRKPNQTGNENFEKLYFHHKTGDQRSGVDLCLPLSNDYYLSFLLKYTLVDGEFTTQSKLHNKIYNEYQVSGITLEKVDMDNAEFAFTQRIGITNSSYKDSPLAVVPVGLIKKYSFGNKESIVKEYIDNCITKDREQLCIKLLGYRSKFVIGE